MKKTLLIISACLIYAITANAQKIWDFGNDVTNFPLNATGIGTGPYPVIINGLSITGIASNANMGVIDGSSKTFTNANNVSFTFTNRFKFNGAGYTGAANTDATPLVFMPTQRYLSFNVSGNSTIYVIGITGSSTSPRKLFVTDGTNLIGSVDFPASSGPVNDGTITYTGAATTLYVFCNAACNLHYLSATNYVSTSVKTVLADKGITYTGNEITNNQGLDLRIFDISGRVIAKSNKAISTNGLTKGIYVVKATGITETLKFSK